MISLEQFITTSRGKTHEKKLGVKTLGSKLGFLPFLSLHHYAHLDLNRGRI